MKQFIYLDTDIVNSIIAQKEKGLVSEFSSESEDTKGKETQKSGAVTLEATGGSSLFKLIQVEAGLTTEGTISGMSHSQTAIKEIALKTLHDAAFDIAYKIISIEYMLKDESIKIGMFAEIEKEFQFIDLCYIENLFEKEGLISYLKKISKTGIEAEAEKLKVGINRDELRNRGAEIRKSIQQAIDTSNKQYDDISDIIKVLHSVIPYERMLVSYDGYLIPLDDKYFRDNPKTIGFKYGGLLTCVGYITNIIGKDNNFDDESNVFCSLNHAVNEVLRSILPTKEDNIYVVHPVALYYGNNKPNE